MVNRRFPPPWLLFACSEGAPAPLGAIRAPWPFCF